MYIYMCVCAYCFPFDPVDNIQNSSGRFSEHQGLGAPSSVVGVLARSILGNYQAITLLAIRHMTIYAVLCSYRYIYVGFAKAHKPT